MNSTSTNMEIVTKVSGELIGLQLTPSVRSEFEERIASLTGGRCRIGGGEDHAPVTVDTKFNDESWVAVQLDGSPRVQFQAGYGEGDAPESYAVGLAVKGS